MRLRRLEVSGFKSFAMRTVLDFAPGITGVVGPNGCGKSNVVDAIRWVLGEQSPRHLRGESMEDVVFKGNDRLAPMGLAQVSLTFENPEPAEPSELDLEVSTLPAHFRGLSEITVSRKYFRSGESEYAINKTPCRLKDITELFLGTGVGSKAYAIIEQGRVEGLIQAKPEERRLFIEEAAGTTLYRSRKQAAERKMERTRENLMRVGDVLHELERQIQYLHRLAKKAEQYQALKAEQQEVDLWVAAVQAHRLEAVRLGLETRRVEVESLTAERSVRLSSGEANRQQMAGEVAAAESEVAGLRETMAALEAEARQLGERQAILARETQERSRRVARMEAELTALGQRVGDWEQRRQEDLESRQGLADRIRTLGEELQEEEARLADAEARAATAQRQLDELRAAASAVVARDADLRGRLGEVERRLESSRRRRTQLAAGMEEAGRHVAQLEQDLAVRRVEIVRVRNRLGELEQVREEATVRREGLATRCRELEAVLREAGDAFLQARSRHDSLSAIQRNYEGYQQGARTLLREANRRPGVLSAVADLLEVPAEHERAVAAALGERMQYVVVDELESGLAAARQLREESLGRASLIPREPRREERSSGEAEGGPGIPLLSLVRFEEAHRSLFEALLGRVFLLPDLETARQAASSVARATFVTPEGDSVDSVGIVTGGVANASGEDIVSRRRQLGELAAVMESSSQRVEESKGVLEQVRSELQAEEERLRQAAAEHQQLSLQRVALERDVERFEAERPRWLDRLDACRGDVRECIEDEALGEQERLRLSAEHVACGVERQRSEAALEAASVSAGGVRREVEERRPAVTALKVALAESRQRHEAQGASVVRIDQQLGEAAGQAERLRQEQARARQEEEELRAEAERTAVAAEACQGRRTETSASLAAARTRFDEVAARVRSTESEIEGLRTELGRLGAESTRLEVSLAQEEMKREHLTAAIREKYDRDVEPAAEDAPEEAYGEAVARAGVVRDKLTRLGDVNPSAVAELAELEGRAEFLRTQRSDLQSSLDDLEKTIQRLNRASRTRFAETFAAVNERFQQLVPRLFRGGEARLVLTDENNLLESGVEILVRPPGKRLESMTLLSGGEKALVAVGLIFSLFLINPTPFCFLDEVDAPLDDANIQRFADLVREMSETSQFIVITHNKRTMQMANLLYGVTMQEPGVSKVLSVAMRDEGAPRATAGVPA